MSISLFSILILCNLVACFCAIQFIQKPSSHPEFCLQLRVPSSAVLHQAALGYFLRQNLLQFLFVPKYQDASRPENTFQDLMSPSGTGACDADVFLYRPQQAGSKGWPFKYIHIVARIIWECSQYNCVFGMLSNRTNVYCANLCESKLRFFSVLFERSGRVVWSCHISFI